MFDLANGDVILSSKVHGAAPGSDLAAAFRNYADDFDAMLDIGDAARRTHQAAELIARGGVPREALPSALRSLTSVEEIFQWLVAHGKMTIPDDHVSLVRAELRKRILSCPDNYYLPIPPPSGMVDALLARVVGNGRTASQAYDDSVGRAGGGEG